MMKKSIPQNKPSQQGENNSHEMQAALRLRASSAANHLEDNQLLHFSKPSHRISNRGKILKSNRGCKVEEHKECCVCRRRRPQPAKRCGSALRRLGSNGKVLGNRVDGQHGIASHIGVSVVEAEADGFDEILFRYFFINRKLNIRQFCICCIYACLHGCFNDLLHQKYVLFLLNPVELLHLHIEVLRQPNVLA